MNEDFMPGIYRGSVQSVILDQVGSNNTLVAKVSFNVPDLGKTVTWSGWFSDKVNQKTNKTYSQLVVEKLVDLGFNGNTLADIVEGNTMALFNTEKVWNLDIDWQVDRDNVRTGYLEVKWINDPDKQYTSKLNRAQAVQATKGYDGLLMKARANTPVNNSHDTSDIPF